MHSITAGFKFLCSFVWEAIVLEKFTTCIFSTSIVTAGPLTPQSYSLQQ